MKCFRIRQLTRAIWIAVSVILVCGCIITPAPTEPEESPGWVKRLQGIKQPEEEMKAISSKVAQDLYLYGMNFYQRGKYKLAIDRFNYAIDEDKNFLAPYVALGELYSLTKQPYLAEKNYKRALDLDPGLVEARVSLGIIYAGQKKYDLALKHLKTALKLQPNHPRAQQYLKLTQQKYAKKLVEQGIAFRNLNNWEQARISFQSAIQADPKSAEAYLELGGVYIYRQQYQPAVENLSTATEITPDSALLWKRLGRAYLGLYEYDQARKALQHSLMLDNADPEGKKLLKLVQQELYRDRPIPEEFLEISYAEAITRGQLAALFALNLRLPPGMSLASVDTAVVIPDISSDWAKEYIIYVVRNKLMDEYPNHYFMPEATVSRGEAASIVDKALQQLAGVRTLTGEPGNRLFKDVSLENQYYGAINRTTALEIMFPESTDFFGITQPLSGLEALETVDRLVDFLARQ